jgi:hypothetical protein
MNLHFLFRVNALSTLSSLGSFKKKSDKVFPYVLVRAYSLSLSVSLASNL